MGILAGVDPQNLLETGWGLVFSREVDPEILKALGNLIARRTEETKGLYFVLTYEPGESVAKFLARYQLAVGSTDSSKVPYYLMLVGSPEQIPFSIQQALSINYAVGRLSFQAPESYAQYARSVVDAESRPPSKQLDDLVFGVQNPDDPWSRQAFDVFLKPVSDMFNQGPLDFDPHRSGMFADTKANLVELFRRKVLEWKLMLTVSHGLVSETNQQINGAILCQDWRGPAKRRSPVPSSSYLAASDVPADADLVGTITMHLSSYSAGRQEVETALSAADVFGTPAAKRPFVSALAERLLSQPAGASLAFIGHVGRFWGFSMPGGSHREVPFYRDLLWRLSRGDRAGYAMRTAGIFWASLAANLSAEMDAAILGIPSDPMTVVEMWVAKNSASSLVLLGDPAVRIMRG